ncbi:MAG: tyrosine-type recombinase/integrase [Acidobacteria bacterium]|nr:tyrosine-type recombinase/integrase [Acidobacteriota bacterium]
MTYLESNGYAEKTIGPRLIHLSCLQRFVDARNLKTLEDFGPQLASDFIDYWVAYQPEARPSTGLKRKSRYGLHHHVLIQYSLRCFLRWAHSTGCLQSNAFPLTPPVRGGYFFPETADYLRFCEEHKGLAKESLRQAELFVRRFDQFLHAVPLTAWNQLRSGHIDLFVRQQASHNIGRIQLIHSALRGLFRYLFSLGRLDRDWASALLSPRRYQLAHTPCPLSVDQVLSLLQSIDRNRRGGKRNFAVFLMAASLGVRASEIAALCLEDLDWAQAVVTFPPVKGNNDLPLPLSRPLIEALADYLKNERPSPSPHRNVFLGLTPPWGPLAPGSVSCLMGRIMRRIGIRGSGHKLRHAFASELLKSGIAFSTLQELLGHSRFTSTEVYTKIDLAQLRQVAINDAEDL